jgi:hypothetical protein
MRFRSVGFCATTQVIAHYLCLVKSRWTKFYMARMPTPEPYRQRVERISEGEGRNYERVAQAVGAKGIEGASRSLIDQAKRNPRKLNRAIIEGVAKELGLKAGEFPEWWAVVIADALRVDEGNIPQVLSNLAVIERGPSEAVLAKLPAAPKRASKQHEDASAQGDRGRAGQILRGAAQRRAGRRKGQTGGGSGSAAGSG